MFEFKKGDIFTTDCKTIVIPVNVAGVMGAGLAKACKEKYPDVFNTYREQCRDIKTKWPVLVNAGPGKYDHNILLFPTKWHWKNDAQLPLIRMCLLRMREPNDGFLQMLESVAFPKIGCGLGHLEWEIVKQTITDILAPLAERIKIEIWE